MFSLGKTSTRRLGSCHPTLQKIVQDAIKTSPIDFGVVCGFRSKEEQDKAFSEGKSNARWGDSDHNFMRGDTPCSLAVDLAPYSAALNNYDWDNKEAFTVLHEHIKKTAYKFGHDIVWGGNFKPFLDMPHFALKI